jgi:hypothetical protein
MGSLQGAGRVHEEKQKQRIKSKTDCARITLNCLDGAQRFLLVAD